MLGETDQQQAWSDKKSKTSIYWAAPIWWIFYMCMCAQLLQLYPTLCDPMDCSPPGSSVHGILQARTLEWAAISSSGDLHDPGFKPTSPVSPALQADSWPLSHWGSPCFTCIISINPLNRSKQWVWLILLTCPTLHSFEMAKTRFHPSVPDCRAHLLATTAGHN